MQTEAERIAALEAHRNEHEGRHTRFEEEIKGELEKINTRFAAGEKKFNSIDLNLGEIKSTLKSIRDSNGNNFSVSKSQSKAKDIVIRIGMPGAAGGGVVAIIVLILQVING